MASKKHVFTQIERKIYLNILKEYSYIVENKNTDGATLNAKKEACNKLTAEYNASLQVTAQVTRQQLRRLWMNLKQRQREALTKERQHRMATGGGPSTSDATIDPDISQVAPALIVGIEQATDSDTIREFTVREDNFDETENLTFEMPTSPIPSSDLIFTARPYPLPSPPPASSTPLLPPSSSTLLPPSSASIPPPPPSSSTPLPPPSSSIPLPPPSSSIPRPPVSSTFQRVKNSILQNEFEERKKRANELHNLEILILKEKLREAKAKADLAELLLEQQRHPSGTQ